METMSVDKILNKCKGAFSKHLSESESKSKLKKRHWSDGECEVALLWRAAQQNHGHGTSKVQTLTVDLTFRESLVP